jgi:glucosylceramidase
MAHFSKFIRPGAVCIGFENTDPSLMVTAAQNPDGSVAVVILNMNPVSKKIKLSLGNRSAELQISAQAIQTIIVLS